MVTGLIYCHVIGACSQVYALDRAREWTAALGRWCDPQPQLGGFAGICMVHRAELMELGGAWSDSIAEARRAEERCRSVAIPKAAADAFYQQAEIHRLRGEFARAEDAYTAASGAGREPLPGLALLRAAQGRPDAAVSAMRRIMATTRQGLPRARYLPAYVEIMLAEGDLEQARIARDELRAIATAFGTDVLRALAAQADAAVLLAEGCADAAVEPLRNAVLVWQRIGAPYLIARLHVQLGRAFRELGDQEGAQLEWAAARDAFAALGAEPDLKLLTALQQQPAHASNRPAPAPADQHGLSTRELEVLRLRRHRQDQPRHRARTAPEREDGRPPRQQHLRQARRLVARGCDRVRVRAPPAVSQVCLGRVPVGRGTALGSSTMPGRKMGNWPEVPRHCRA